MYIEKRLFDECFCPCSGVGRVCLMGSDDIPEELVSEAEKIDGDNYLASCFSIDVYDGGALICYSGENEFKELCVCDNYEEVLEYYKANADKDDLEETFKDWEE